MKIDIHTLTELALESTDLKVDKAQFILMASHVAEIIEAQDDKSMPWVLGASLVNLLVENFHLQQQLVGCKNES